MSEQSVLPAQEQWLRTNGLPFVVPARRRLRGLVPRVSAVLITFFFLATALLIADAAISSDDVIPLLEVVQHPGVLVALGTAAVVALLSIPAGLVYLRWQRRLGFGPRLAVAITVWVLWIAGLSVAAALSNARLGLHLPIGIRLGLLVLALVLAWLELDHIVAWAARRSVQELAAALPAVARTLPVLLLTVLLAFFTGELWQIAATITKARMWALGLFLTSLIVIIVIPATRDMLDEADKPEREEPLVDGTPFQGVSPTHSRLSVGERFNLLIVSLAVQAVQIALFVIATFAVFTIFGTITLTPELIAQWSGHAAQQLVWLGIALPMDWAVFRVCLVLALFAGVSFAAATLQDAIYRTMFLDRVADEVRRNLAARHRYRTCLHLAGKMPARWQLLVVPDDH